MHVNVDVLSKKKVSANKTESFLMSICKQILGFKKCTNNIKVLSELGRTPLKVDIGTKMPFTKILQGQVAINGGMKNPYRDNINGTYTILKFEEGNN